MARRRAAARQEDLEDFSEELQNLPLEPTSGDEDESYEPVRLPRRNVNRTIPAAGTAADSLPPGMISTVAGTTTNFPVTDSTGVAGDTSDRPPPVILNDPDEGSSRKVRPTDDLAWFFDTDEETGIRTCKLCRDEKLAGKQTPNHTYRKGTGNTNLRGHIDRNHNALYIRQAGILGWGNKLPSFRSQQSSLGQTDRDSAGSPGSPRPDDFTVAKLHRALIRFVTADDQSISVLGCPEFRELLLLLRSDLKDSDIPHRTKGRALIIEAWKHHFMDLRAELAKSAGAISFTADLWTDDNLRSHIAVTAHWISDSNEFNAVPTFRAALIAFHRLSGRHTGENLANVMMSILDRAKITVKAGHFTMDNAENNTTMMKSLEELFHQRDLEFDAKERQVFCFPHTTNICTGHVLSSLTSFGIDSEPRDDHVVSGRQTYAQAVARDPIAMARAAIRAIRVSSARRDAFLAVIKDGNKDGRFKDPNTKNTIQLKPLQLLRDIPTRWDSVYYMINRFRYLRQAVDNLLGQPHLPELAKYRLTSTEWDVLQDFEVILSVPHQIQHRLAGDKLPVLAYAIPIFEMFMTKWEKLADQNPRLAQFIKEGLRFAYIHYKKMDRTKAYIICMFLNPKVKLVWIRKNWDAEYIADAETKVKTTMQKYRDRTATACDPTTTPVANRSGPVEPSIEQLAHTYGLSEEDELDWSGETSDVQSVEQEFQAYITEPRSGESDILHYWKLHQTSFPTLYAMAMDYLPIQASSVSCERVFSSSSETDTKKRNRINGLLMEALQMLKFSIKRDRLSVNERFPNTVENDMVFDDLTPDYTPDRPIPPSILTELADATDGSDMQNVLDRAIAATEPAAVDNQPAVV